MTMRRRLTISSLVTLMAVAPTWNSGLAAEAGGDSTKRPNILFIIAEDWSWPHVGLAGDPIVETPTIDRLGREGIVFSRAHATSPGCTASRASILTGQWFARLEQGAVHHSYLPAKFPAFPLRLEDGGYAIGHQGKVGIPSSKQRKNILAGSGFGSFEKFLDEAPEDEPFFFWYGSSDAHRGYDLDQAVKEVDPAKIPVPDHLPNTETVRRDLAGYYHEIQQFDSQVADLLQELKDRGEFKDTLVIVTGDHGMPFPRCKSELYDCGTHVPLVVSWPGKLHAGRRVSDFVSLADLGPTLLELAGENIPAQMTGRSFRDILFSRREGQVGLHRSHVLAGKERHHGLCRPDGKTYPTRAIRTENFLYIRNFKPQRWPAGSPYLSSSQGIFSDVDSAPTKNWMIQHASKPRIQPLFMLSFAKRPKEELYDLRTDPDEIHNVASEAKYQRLKEHLGNTLIRELKARRDPRVLGQGEQFNNYEYFVGYGVEKVDPPQPVKEALGLK